MACSIFWFSLAFLPASLSTIRTITRFSSGVIASLPNLNPRRIFYGSTTDEDDRGDEVEKLLAAHPAVLSGGGDRTGQALSPVTGPTHTRGDSLLSIASGKARFIAEFTQRGNLGDEVLLSPDVELERQAVVYSAEKAELATARSVRPEGSRTVAVGHGKTARSLSVDDGLRHGVAGQ